MLNSKNVINNDFASTKTTRENLSGVAGGVWDEKTHAELYGNNLNNGLSEFIAEELVPNSLLEFGCGTAALANRLAELLPLNDSYCIEPNMKPHLNHGLHLLNFDFTTEPAPAQLDRYFDLVVSIEVAEHIDKRFHTPFFDFLVSRANKWIVFSAARPGQGGHGHISERPELEWRAEFEQRGCVFDSKMTAVARTMSDQKNINHQRNVQVFSAPHRNRDLLELEDRAKPYLANLLKILSGHASRVTGGLFYENFQNALGLRPEHSLMWKRQNLCQLAKIASNILEIGFAGGHSALLYLLANSHSKITVVDPLSLPYARSCFEYLDKSFPGRMKLIQSLSGDALPILPPSSFDLVHLDGGKEKTISSDLQYISRLVQRDHVLIVDDMQNQGVACEVNSWKVKNTINSDAFRSMNLLAQKSRWTHEVCGYTGQKFSKDQIYSELERLYFDTEIESIYRTRDEAGKILGHKRAEHLINTIVDVELGNIQGAFVEVGVAAGHSSAIAALTASKFIERDFFLYDTFMGFADDLPDELDFCQKSIKDYDLSKYKSQACSKSEVMLKLLNAGCPKDLLHLIPGPAEETTQSVKPQQISVLRLDCDLFEPTLVSLEQLFPNISPGGYVIVDEYGHWGGCKQAVDMFLDTYAPETELIKVDYTCYYFRKMD